MMMTLIGAGTYPMGTRDAVEAFIRAINSHDVDAISHCMTEDHVFIDSLGNRVTGQQAMSSGWRAYFAMFPDYQITFQTLMSEADEAMLCGQATGTFFRTGSPADGSKVILQAAWRAIVVKDKIALWQVYADNKIVYDFLAS